VSPTQAGSHRASCTRNFTLQTRKAPHLVAAVYVVQASLALNFTVQTRKASNMWSVWHPMLTLIREKSDLEGDESVMEH